MGDIHDIDTAHVPLDKEKKEGILPKNYLYLLEISKLDRSDANSETLFKKLLQIYNNANNKVKEKIYLNVVASMKDPLHPEGIFSEQEVKAFFHEIATQKKEISKDTHVTAAKLPKGHVFHSNTLLSFMDTYGGLPPEAQMEGILQGSICTPDNEVTRITPVHTSKFITPSLTAQLVLSIKNPEQYKALLHDIFQRITTHEQQQITDTLEKTKNTYHAMIHGIIAIETTVTDTLFRTRKSYQNKDVSTIKQREYRSQFLLLLKELSKKEKILPSFGQIKYFFTKKNASSMIDVKALAPFVEKNPLQFEKSFRATETQKKWSNLPSEHNELQRFNIVYAHVQKQGGEWTEEQMNAYMDLYPFHKDHLYAGVSLREAAAFFKKKTSSSPRHSIAFSDKSGIYASALSGSTLGNEVTHTSHIYQDQWKQHHKANSLCLSEEELKHVPQQDYDLLFSQNWEELPNASQVTQLLQILTLCKAEGIIHMISREELSNEVRTLLEEYGFLAHQFNAAAQIAYEDSSIDPHTFDRTQQKLKQKHFSMFEKTHHLGEDALLEIEKKLATCTLWKSSAEEIVSVQQGQLPEEKEQFIEVIWDMYLEDKQECSKENFMIYCTFFIQYQGLTSMSLPHIASPLSRFHLSLEELDALLPHLLQIPGAKEILEEVLFDKYFLNFTLDLLPQALYIQSIFHFEKEYLPEEIYRELYPEIQPIILVDREEIMTEESAPPEFQAPDTPQTISVVEKKLPINLYGIEWHEGEEISEELFFTVLDRFIKKTDLYTQVAMPLWYTNILDFNGFYTSVVDSLDTAVQTYLFSSWHLPILIQLVEIYEQHPDFLRFLKDTSTTKLFGNKTVHNYLSGIHPQTGLSVTFPFFNFINGLHSGTFDALVKREQSTAGIISRTLKKTEYRHKLYSPLDGKLQITLLEDKEKNGQWESKLCTVPDHYVRNPLHVREQTRDLQGTLQLFMQIYLEHYLDRPPRNVLTLPKFAEISLATENGRNALIRAMIKKYKLPTFDSPSTATGTDIVTHYASLLQSLKYSLFYYLPPVFLDLIIKDAKAFDQYFGYVLEFYSKEVRGGMVE